MAVKLQAFDFPGVAICLDSLTGPGDFVARTNLLIDRNSTDSLLRIPLNSPLPSGYTAYAELSGSFSYHNDKKSIADVAGYLTKQIFYISDGSIAYKVKSEEIIGATFDVRYLGDENINSPLINYLYVMSLLSDNDIFIGSTGIVPNGQFDEQILGLTGNDSFSGNSGNDYFDGGVGIDTAIFRGVLSAYTITASPSIIDRTDAVNKKLLSGYLVSDKTINRDGIDTLTNVERLKFSDTNVALDIAPTQNAGSVYMLYKAAFNRAPDSNGMGYWLAQKDGGSNIVTNIAQGFVNAPEFVAKYGTNPSNASYVDKLYQNVLGRAGESGGVTYWNQELDAGRITKAAVLVQFATLAEGASKVASLIANGIPYTEFVG